jgi:WG containing repeat
MKRRARFATPTKALFATCCLFCLPLQAADEGAAPPGQAAEPQSPAKDANPLFPVVDHGKWGYIDKDGKIVISPQYTDAGPFKEGFARIEPWAVIGGHGAVRIYFINKSGGIMNISRIYSQAQDFSEGLALVGVAGERGMGYIDTTGQMVIPQNDSYQVARPFREGLAAIKQGGKWGYLDKTGKMAIEPQFAEALRFSEGLAAVKNGDKWGYIDKSGKMAIAAQFETAYQHEGGLAAVKQDGKWGFIDATGNMVIAPQFEEAYGFSEGLVDVKLGGKWGYCDKNGKMVIAATYEGAHAHFDGLAGVKQGGKWGFVDVTGNMVIQAQFDEAGSFSDGLAEVKVGKKFGYVDKTGKYVWAPSR